MNGKSDLTNSCVILRCHFYLVLVKGFYVRVVKNGLQFVMGILDDETNT